MSRPLFFVLFFISLEIFVLVASSGIVGVILTLLFTIVSMAVGVSLCRSRGLRSLNQAKQDYFQEINQLEELADNVGVLLAGFLMIIPGFITDFIGLLALIPSLRALIVKKVLEHFSDILSAKMSKFGTPYSGDDNLGPVVDAEYFETSPRCSKASVARPKSFDMKRN